MINTKKYVLPFARRDNYRDKFLFDIIISWWWMFPDYHLFLLSDQYISSSLKNRIAEHYPDSQIISQQELCVRICCILSIKNVIACFDHGYSTAVLQTDV